MLLSKVKIKNLKFIKHQFEISIKICYNISRKEGVKYAKNIFGK